MSLTTCGKCQGKVSTTASLCPHCGGEPSADPFTCPECSAVVPSNRDACQDCGFPLKPGRAPAPAATPRAAPSRRRRQRRFGAGRKILGESEEVPGALIFAILGLFVPILSIVGLLMSKRGTAARTISIVGVALFALGILFIAFMASRA